MRKPSCISLVAILLATTAAADERFAGDWMLELTGEGPPIIGMLSLRQAGETWIGHVEGGPVGVTIDGDALTVVVDSRDLQGFTFNRILEGRLDGETLSGTFTAEGASFADEPGGDWVGIRKSPQRPRQPPAPVDITGPWQPAPGIDFRKYSMDLTPAAQAWFDDYLMHYDQPNVRCVSPGIVAMVAWGGYPMEILGSENRLTFLYEVESEVRRIFLDGKEPPEFYPTSSMGWSNGYWDGSDLVIETQLIEGNVRDFRGEPVSDGARMRERYSLSEDGGTLSAVIHLIDPDNYKYPPIRRRQWVRKADIDIYPWECDPDSFYRQMYNEGKLDMYFERSQRRIME